MENFDCNKCKKQNNCPMIKINITMIYRLGYCGYYENEDENEDI